jgi:type IV secretion system protein VirB5
VLIVCALAVNAPARATGIPVIDVANLIQDVQQFLQLTAQLQQLEQQYAQAVQQYQSLTGSRNMGALFNAGLDQQMRLYAPATWQRSLLVLQQGGLPGNAADVARAARAFAQSEGILDTGAQVYPGAGGSNADALAYSGSANATAATAGLGQAAYDQTQARMQRVQQYLDQINATPDLKASVDLNARLLAEVNEALTQMIQLQAAQMQVLAAGNAALLHGKAQDTAFTPYNVP